MKKLLIIGPPGAGKGTMSKMIEKEFGIPTFSTGELLRSEIKKETELGQLAASLIDKGHFVPDDVIAQIVRDALKEMPNGYLLDGFPRSVPQAEVFDGMLQESGDSLDAILHLRIDDSVIINRLSNRLVCGACGQTFHRMNMKPKTEGICDSCGGQLERRKDDEPEFIQTRLNLYHELTKPLVSYYEKRGFVFHIDSDCSANEQFAQIDSILRSL